MFQSLLLKLSRQDRPRGCFRSDGLDPRAVVRSLCPSWLLSSGENVKYSDDLSARRTRRLVKVLCSCCFVKDVSLRSLVMWKYQVSLCSSRPYGLESSSIRLSE